MFQQISALIDKLPANTRPGVIVILVVCACVYGFLELQTTKAQADKAKAETDAIQAKATKADRAILQENEALKATIQFTHHEGKKRERRLHRRIRDLERQVDKLETTVNLLQFGLYGTMPAGAKVERDGQRLEKHPGPSDMDGSDVPSTTKLDEVGVEVDRQGDLKFKSRPALPWDEQAKQAPELEVLTTQQ